MAAAAVLPLPQHQDHHDVPQCNPTTLLILSLGSLNKMSLTPQSALYYERSHQDLCDSSLWSLLSILNFHSLNVLTKVPVSEPSHIPSSPWGPPSSWAWCWPSPGCCWISWSLLSRSCSQTCILLPMPTQTMANSVASSSVHNDNPHPLGPDTGPLQVTLRPNGLFHLDPVLRLVLYILK